jgi:hypothetical protein
MPKRLRLNKKFDSEIEQSREEIISTLENTEYYHGTGAYHYDFEETKYDGKLKGVKYSLDSILSEGLVPQRDYFNEIMQTGEEKTISLSKIQPYARCYADLFNFENNSKGYRLGSPYFWGAIIASTMMKHELSTFSFEKRREIKEKRKTIEYHKKREKLVEHNIKMLDGWTRSFRKDGKYEGRNFIFSINDGSDIPNNFGIVIGIKKGAVSVLPNRYKGITLYEARTNQRIYSSDFSHVEAPLENIKSVHEQMIKLNLNIPIFPIEFVESINYNIRNYGINNNK